MHNLDDANGKTQFETVIHVQEDYICLSQLHWRMEKKYVNLLQKYQVHGHLTLENKYMDSAMAYRKH